MTVQLPLYNERYVAERAIRALAALEYPKELLEVQVLDDSTDATSDVVARVVRELRNRGVRIHHLRRAVRTGFNAGALAEGLAKASGDLVAIFDADFIPYPDFLRRIVGEFDRADVGMVQARWSHINEDHSLLTKTQALQLDAHFTLEHGVRAAKGLFFNFNGTAGVWRKQAILDSGGWQDDTLTEDLDLSYRAQLAGWRFLFLPHVVCPAELPVDIIAFKNQQHRWTKGALQTAKKILPLLWRSRFPLSVKIEATVHLTSNVGYLLTVIFSVTMLPSLLLRYRLYGTTLDWLELWT
ncbi:MAG: glycosyltransferase, partial [Acidobacteria bacterium]|nr:glycosyltransferase [Acidobacteriota bacterium]